jgi:hypothetical protein
MVEASRTARARDDHASIRSFEASLSVWRWKTVSGAPRESTASC